MSSHYIGLKVEIRIHVHCNVNFFEIFTYPRPESSTQLPFRMSLIVVFYVCQIFSHLGFNILMASLGYGKVLKKFNTYLPLEIC